jgi:hypothetical protein
VKELKGAVEATRRRRLFVRIPEPTHHPSGLSQASSR